MRLAKVKLTILILSTLLLTSCTRYKNLVYLQEDTTQTTSYTAQHSDYKIKSKDILYIRILSLNDEVTKLINTQSNIGNNQFTNDASLYIFGYNVSDSGYVEIPVIGKVYVKDSTLEKAKKIIAQKAANYIKNPTITVKLISFKYTVMGEVNAPGVYLNYNNQLNVLEAISRAGDISPFGNRKKVLVIRTESSETKVYKHNLTRADILGSRGFYLLPNDIIYVEPVPSYGLRMNLPTISAFFTAVSTFILVLDYINK